MGWTQWLMCGVGSLMLLSGCAATGGTAASRDKTLFERVGGKPYLTAIVDDFVVRLEGNRRLQPFFTATDRAAWQARLFTQFCSASGGPCKAPGPGMMGMPRGMGMTSVDFDVLGEEFAVTLDKFKIVEPEKRALLAFLEPLRQELLQR